MLLNLEPFEINAERENRFSIVSQLTKAFVFCLFLKLDHPSIVSIKQILIFINRVETNL